MLYILSFLEPNNCEQTFLATLHPGATKMINNYGSIAAYLEYSHIKWVELFGQGHSVTHTYRN